MQPIPLKCEVCGNGGVAAELLSVIMCSACTNIAAKSMDKINVAVHDIVIATVQKIMPKPFVVNDNTNIVDEKKP